MTGSNRPDGAASMDDFTPMQFAIIDVMLEGFVLTDASIEDNPIVYINQRFTEMTGYTSDQVLVVHA